MRKSIVCVLSMAAFARAESSVEPAPRTREYNWMSVATWKKKHEANVNRAKQGGVDVLFLGDSITEGWGGNAVWKKHYEPRKAANFGIGGDTTQNVLWRLSNGEADGITPKVVVLLIGTNNFGLHGDKPDAVAKGVGAVVETLRKKFPDARVLLLGIFPRDAKPETGMRKNIAAVNTIIAKLDDGKAVRYLDIGSKFLNVDGTLPKELMPDALHLSPKGYGVWAEAMEPLLVEMLGG